MDISGKIPPVLPPQYAQGTGASQKAAPAPAARPAAAGDSVSLSPRVRELQAARETLASLPEIREEKVAAIRAQIEAGTYAVDSEKVAGKMIAEALLNAHLK
jgi:negative regulator of flagellin synthesis FlgM